MSDEDSSVWIVYDRLRSARLNVKYYGRRLQSVERLNFWLEVTLLAAAPSSAIAGLWFWKQETGQAIWQYMGILTAIVAVVKPPLALARRIKEYESILTGYRTLEFDLLEIKSQIDQRKKYDASLQSEMKKAFQREKILAGKTPEATENKRVKRICEAEVLKELPSEMFYIPQGEDK